MSRVVHSLDEYIELVCWAPPGTTTTMDDPAFVNAINDLRDVLFVYGGVRLRDIRNLFISAVGKDINFKALELDGWPAFLVACRDSIDFRLDLVGDIAFAFVSQSALQEMGQHNSHLQTLFTATPRNRKDEPVRRANSLAIIKPRKAFMEGYLDVPS